MVEPVRDGRSRSRTSRAAESADCGRRRSTAPVVYGRRPKIPTSWPGLEAKAQAVLSRRAWAYLAGGAGLESTIQANADGFERWRIVPRVLHDVAHRYLTVELFGRVLPAPLLLGPVGVLSLAHRDADVAAARAAAAERVPIVLSNQASRSMEECVAVMGDSPRWFQLYWSTVDELVESFLARAEACRCDAIVVTLDTTLLGWRPRDLDLGSLPFAHGLGIAQYTSDPVFTRLVERSGPAVVSVTAAAATHCGGVAGTAVYRPDPPRTDLDQPPVAATTCGGRDIPRHLLAPVDHLARPRLAPRPHPAADRPQGHLASGRCPPCG